MTSADLIPLIVLAFASYRVTRFFVKDSLMGFGPESGSAVSVWVDRFAYDRTGADRSWWRGKIGDLLTCVFCLGFWITLGLFAGWFQTWPWDLDVQQWITVFAVAGAQSYLSTRMNA